MGSCVAFNCTNRKSKKLPGITFHRFPKDETKRVAWIIAVRRKNWVPTSASRICSAHFPEHMIDRSSLACVRLREGAVPSIFKFPPHLQKVVKESKPRLKRKKRNLTQPSTSSNFQMECPETLDPPADNVTDTKLFYKRKVELDDLLV